LQVTFFKQELLEAGRKNSDFPCRQGPVLEQRIYIVV